MPTTNTKSEQTKTVDVEQVTTRGLPIINNYPNMLAGSGSAQSPSQNGQSDQQSKKQD